ncbi:hypothetical protein KIH87_16445 [Paraneptunicella aestuarii]|uniref:DUF6776 family protein n=1 Tax=Paraneptunicella aestuarii TaxID=2831148 RepID=UPI001E3F70F2|nr:DUF6776 family protein [Paraneptunicella aestuarii]UAA38258.1 hypothetical protein KIH87_16445 [Paraneptunicella aestuarii]
MALTSLKQRFGTFWFYVLLALAMTASFGAGFYLKGWKIDTQSERLAMLEHSLGNLKSENEDLVKRLNILGIELEVSRLANEKSQQTIQEEIEAQIELRRELSFYQKVMAPELDQEGFVIDSFEVTETNSENYFRYALILMQHDKRRDKVKGNVTVTLIGSQNGKPAKHELTSLIPESSEFLVFNFRYFEVLKGEFRLPPGFLPERVQVESVLSEAKWGKRNLERTFAWQPHPENTAVDNT